MNLLNASLHMILDKKHSFPKEMWRKFGDMGLLGITAPEEFGGQNMGYLAHTIAMEEVSRPLAASL